MTENLTSVRSALNVQPGRVFVDGAWLDWAGPRFDQIHPSTNEVMASFPEVGRRGVDLAVAAARNAFDNGPWPTMRAQDRKRVIQPIVDAIRAVADEVHRLQCLDNGMPYHMTRNSRECGSRHVRLLCGMDRQDPRRDISDLLRHLEHATHDIPGSDRRRRGGPAL